MSALSSDANAGASEVRDGFAINEAALARWMEAKIPDYRGPLEVRQFKGGQSNPTYLLITPGRRYVMRRKPPGTLLKGAHAVDREARIQSALWGTDVPVARIYGLCTDETVIGSWFYVMEHLEGRIFWDARFPDVAREERPAYFMAMTQTLARLHSVDYRAAGLEDFGKPASYFERQIARWTRAYQEDEAAGRDPRMDDLLARLPLFIPKEEETTIVHGDFRCDNMVFHPTEPRVIGILDWELSTLGHPISDFAYHAMMYHMPPHIVAGLKGADLATLNIPDEQACVDAYVKATGRAEIGNWSFYMAFNFFRMAAIFHGIRGRVLRGTAASAHARERADSFFELVEIAHRALERCA